MNVKKRPTKANVMHTIRDELFLVDGRESRLTIEPDSIVWETANNSYSDINKQPSTTPTNHDTSRKVHLTSAAANRLSFAQIIGTNQSSSSKSRPNGDDHAGNNNTKKRLKIYYAKDNEFKSTSRLLKIKSLTIESIKKSPAESRTTIPDLGNQPTTTTTTATTTQHHKSSTGDDRAPSEPPSCYASDGSTSHLSNSSSTCSSPIQPSEPETGTKQAAAASLDEFCKLIQTRLELERQQNRRPRRLLVFVNPYGGKGKAVRLYKSKVRRLFALANVQTELVVTKHANHARDTIEDPAFEVEKFDAIICVGGDGMFSELMNGLLFRYNRDKILNAKLAKDDRLSSGISTASEQRQHQTTASSGNHRDTSIECSSESSSSSGSSGSSLDLESLRSALGGIGRPLVSPPLPVGVIGAGSTDANSFGLLGTNDVVTATLNIILGKQIYIDICSVHTIEEDRLLRFVSTFVAYGYFGDVVRESERLRWLGPSRYDVTGVNSLIKNRAYQGKVRILVSSQDGSPKDTKRCCTNCDLCNQLKGSPLESELEFVERGGSFVGVNAAITACRCPQTKKGFSPNNHLANGCVDLILVRPCSRMQYVQYLLRTGWTKKSAFDLKYVEAYRCRQFEFISQHDPAADIHPTARPLGLISDVSSSSSSALSSSSASNSGSLESGKNSSVPIGTSSTNPNRSPFASSWNVDGEIMDEASIRVKVNHKLLRVFGTGEPNPGAHIL